MKHCISIVPESGYSTILEEVADEDKSVEARELTDEVDGNGDPYQLLTLITRDKLSDITELTVLKLDNVIVTTFNIEE